MEESIIFADQAGVEFCDDCRRVLHPKELQFISRRKDKDHCCTICYGDRTDKWKNNAEARKKAVRKWKCPGCNGSYDWCRGCGSGDKVDALVEYGIPEEVADKIVRWQFGGCGDPIPCYLCNSFGLDGDLETTHGFWFKQQEVDYDEALAKKWKRYEDP